MRTKTKALVLALCAVLLVVTTVFVTMAFLTSEDSVQNTFTVGEVTISLDELDVDEDDLLTDNKEYTKDGITTTRDKANEYKLIPGKTYIKDPTIHVGAKSEPCYLFVKVENGLVNAEAEGNTTIAAQMTANGWYPVNGASDVYYYGTANGIVAVNGGQDKVVFEEFTIDGDAVVANYHTLKDADGNVTNGKAITVTAYAIQAECFENTAIADIWAEF